MQNLRYQRSHTIEELSRRFDVDMSRQAKPGMRAVIEQLMRDPSKAQEIFEKLKEEDPALLMELLEWIKRQQK